MNPFLANWYRATLLVLLFGAFSPAALAEGGDDWVLVKRFEEQMQKANQGDVQAMYEVGRMYERGRGIETDINRALTWFEKAAQKGNHSASARIGILHLEGQGIAQDYKKAYEHLSIAATAGNPAAQYFLALMHEEGHGVPANSDKAMTWYKRAETGGYYQAQQAIARLEARARRPLLDQPADTPADKPKAVARPKVKPDLTRSLIETVLGGQWQRGGDHAGFLPSAASTCKEEDNKVIKCLSAQLSRDTGYSVISYVTVAELSDFSANDEFVVNYYNNVLDVKEKNASADVGQADDGFGGNAAATSRVKLGKQSAEHHLDCTLKSKNTIECVKNLTTTMTFENKK